MIDGYAQWAQQYRSRLWTGVLPLPPRAKSPLPKGYTGRAGKNPDDAQIDTWCRRWANGNIALRMPGDVLGIDVDDYPYTFTEEDPETGETYEVNGVKTGGATLAALEAELGPLPATWRSSSRGDGPSGIRLFKVPPGLLWGDFGTHLEGIWWGHRYAVVYPSINPDSDRRYEWINDAADTPTWGEPPPKVTDLVDLPESWVARFGRTADQPKAPRTVPGTPRRSPVADYSGSRRFTRAQAADFVQPHLDALRHETPGAINNRLNDAAKAISHFVPAFWSPAGADALLWDALKATAYDGNTWKAEHTIASAFESAVGDWVAELAPDRPERPTRTTAVPRPVAPHGEPDDVPPEDPEPPEVSGFWDARPLLRYVHEYATAHETNPWAVLGVGLARVIAATEPNIQLPGAPVTIGTEASLNMFVALVSESGGGKTMSTKVSRRMLDIRFGMDPLDTFEAPLGSGEGLSHIYMRPAEKLKPRRGKDADEDSETIGLTGNYASGPVQHRTRAFIKALEIDQLEAVSKRNGSTLSPQLRTAWDGDELGAYYADPLKRMMVPDMGYRMSLVLGVQPGRAGPLLAEADGGLPQRFLWLPAENRELPEYAEDEDVPDLMAPIVWQPPIYSAGRAVFGLCDTARHAIKRNHRKNMRGDGDALSSHSMLTREKVAAALAMLLGDTPPSQMMIDDEVWDLSGVMMAKSDRTRDGIQRFLAQQAREQNEKQAFAKAREAIVITETMENDAMGKAVRWVRSKVGSDGLTRREIQQGPKSLRGHLLDALQKLLDSGELMAEEYQSGTRTAMRYRMANPNEADK